MNWRKITLWVAMCCFAFSPVNLFAAEEESNNLPFLSDLSLEEFNSAIDKISSSEMINKLPDADAAEAATTKADEDLKAAKKAATKAEENLDNAKKANTKAEEDLNAVKEANTKAAADAAEHPKNTSLAAVAKITAEAFMAAKATVKRTAEAVKAAEATAKSTAEAVTVAETTAKSAADAAKTATAAAAASTDKSAAQTLLNNSKKDLQSMADGVASGDITTTNKLKEKLTKIYEGLKYAPVFTKNADINVETDITDKIERPLKKIYRNFKNNLVDLSEICSDKDLTNFEVETECGMYAEFQVGVELIGTKQFSDAFPRAMFRSRSIFWEVDLYPTIGKKVFLMEHTLTWVGG